MPDLPYDVADRALLLRSENAGAEVEIPPERRLMIALVRDAIRCIVRYRSGRDSRSRRLFAEEVQWVLSDDMDWFYAFARVCETLDLDAESVRRSLGLRAPGFVASRAVRRTPRGPRRALRNLPLVRILPC